MVHHCVGIVVCVVGEHMVHHCVGIVVGVVGGYMVHHCVGIVVCVVGEHMVHHCVGIVVGVVNSSIAVGFPKPNLSILAPIMATPYCVIQSLLKYFFLFSRA